MGDKFEKNTHIVFFYTRFHSINLFLFLVSFGIERSVEAQNYLGIRILRSNTSIFSSSQHKCTPVSCDVKIILKFYFFSYECVQFEYYGYSFFESQTSTLRLIENFL